MKRSLKHGGSLALRVGAAVGLTTVGVVTVGAAPAFARTVAQVAQVTDMSYNHGTVTVRANTKLLDTRSTPVLLQVIPPDGASYFVEPSGESDDMKKFKFPVPKGLTAGTHLDFFAVGFSRGHGVGNPLWVVGSDGTTLASVETAVFSSNDYPRSLTSAYSFNGTNNTADATLSFDGPTAGYSDQGAGVTLSNFVVTVSSPDGTVVGPETVTPNAKGQYTAQFSGLKPGVKYLYAVTANYLPTSTGSSGPVPLTSCSYSTVPSARALAPSFPAVSDLTATPSYAHQSTFTIPQETIAWDGVGSSYTAGNETYTLEGYQVSYGVLGVGQPTTLSVHHSAKSVTFNVQQGEEYGYSVAAVWMSTSGTIITGNPKTGGFVANSSLGVPTLTSLSSGEEGSTPAPLQISGSFNTPNQPTHGATAINAQYQVILTDGSKTYSVFTTPVTLGWGQSGVDFSVNNGQFHFKLGDQVTATVVATFYDGSNVVGVSNSVPSTITVSNAAQLAGPQNVVFAMSKDLGGTVSWTGPNGSAVPTGYSLNGFTVEVVNPTDRSQVYWVDSQIGVNSSGTDYNVGIPASITGAFQKGSSYKALVYANYTDTATASQTTVGASASSSLYTPSSSLPVGIAPPESQQEYVNGTPALKVSWNALPSVSTQNAATGPIVPKSYTLLYAPLSSFDGSEVGGSGLEPSGLKTVVGITPAANDGVTSTMLTGLKPGTRYGFIVLAQYPLYGETSGTFVGSETPLGEARTYAALPQPSVTSLGFSSTAGALELTVDAKTLQVTNPSGIRATYSIKVSNQATGMSHTYGPFGGSGTTLQETLQSSRSSLLFGVGQNLSVKVIANYSLDNKPVGSVTSGSMQGTATDAALALPGAQNISATVINDQNGNPTMASVSFGVPTGSASRGWSIEGYDVVVTGTKSVPLANAYFPASGTSGASSNVVAFDCTQGNCAVLLDGLTAGYAYGITVMPVYVNGTNEALGTSAQFAKSLTMSNGVSAAVSNIVLAPGSSNSVPSMSASWEPPVTGSTNGLTIKGYEVQLYQNRASSNVAVGVPRMVTTTGAVFNDLNELDSYSVGVTALLQTSNGALVYGPTVYSGSEAEAQNLATAPVENVTLKASNSQTGALDISWQVQAGDKYEKPSSFVIHLSEGSISAGTMAVAASSLTSTTSHGVTTYSDTLTGLDPSYVYEATVIPYSGVGGTGVAGMPGTSLAGATPYSTYVSNASVSNNAPGNIQVSFTGPRSTRYQLEVTDEYRNVIVGPEYATESTSAPGNYSANFSIPSGSEGRMLFVAITPVGSSGQPSPTFTAPFTAYSAPGPVGNLEVTASGATSVSLGWMAPSVRSHKASGAVTDYAVSWWQGNTKVGSATTSNLDYTISDLSPGVNYTFQVESVNANGFTSVPSQIGFTPAAGSVSGPLNLSSQPTTGGLLLSWDAPTSSELGGNTLGNTPVYKVTLTNEVTHSPQSFDVSTNSYSAQGLSDGAAYRVSVRAQVVSASSGSKTFWSSPSTIGPDGSTTPAVGPDPVSNLKVYVSAGHAVVNWNSVVGATGYQVSVDGGTPVSTNDSTTYAFPAKAGHEYSIEVWATNGLELSAPQEVNEFVASGPVMPVIKEAAPATVGSASDPLASSPSSTSDVTVKFTAPLTIGSAEIHSYTIDLYARGSAGVPQLLKAVTLTATQIQQGLNGGLYSHTFSGIANGDVVWANVSANSSSSESTSSQTGPLDVIGVTPAPSQVSALPVGNMINLSFDAPSNLNGGALMAAEVYWEGSDHLLHAVRVLKGSLSYNNGAYGYSIAGLTNGASYQVWVAWVNQLGQIGQIGQAVDTTGTGGTTLTPYVPFSASLRNEVSVSARDVRSGVVNVSFTALPSKYSPQYVIEYSTNGGSPETLTVPSTVTATGGLYTVPVTGLTNGESYTFKVVAYAGFVNNSGPGGSLVEGTASATPYGLPGQVTVSSMTTGDKQFSMSWKAPTADGGTPIEGYHVSILGSGGSIYSGNVDTANPTAGGSITENGLNNNESYTVTIYAYNAVGNGPSTTLTVTPESGSPVVTNLVVTPTPGNGSVTLSIPAATAGNQASPITDYEYRYGQTSKGFTSGWIQVPTTETSGNPIVTTVDGLTNGTEYSFQVQALSGTVAVSYPTVNAMPVAPAATGPTVPITITRTITRTITIVEPSTLPSSVQPSTLPSSVQPSTLPSSVKVPFAMVAADGGYFNHDAPFDNSLPGEKVSTGAIVGGAPAGPSGYWMVSSNGTVYAFGSAHSYGNVTNLSGKVVGMAPTPDGGGYWIATNTGNIYAFGNAARYGGVGRYGITGLTGSHPLNAPIVGIAALPNGSGLYLVAADGGVFNFGSAQLYGSTYSLGLTGLTGLHPLNAPIVGIAVDPSGTGYLLIGADGGVFNLGSAQYHGSTYTDGITGLTGLHPLNAPIVGGAFGPTTSGEQGYYLFAADGGVFNFGSAPYEGSDANLRLAKPIVGGFVFPS